MTNPIRGGKLCRFIVCAGAAVMTITAGWALAGQVILDGTVGPAGARLGPNFVIPQSVGRLQGTNLFHSFSQFNISAGESATFTANTGTTVTNVIARVTGTSSSSINGLVRSDIPNANLFLINPNGIVFGPMAQLDVQGSFVASTGSYVRLADGARFSTVAPNDALLTSAPPEAFGFLGKNAGSITFTGPAGGASASQGGVLAVPEGKSIALIGGPVQVTSGQLQANGGQVTVASVAGKGEFQLDVSSQFPTPSFTPQNTVLGPVQLTGGASLSATVGGRVVVRSGSLDVNASSITAATDVVPGGGIDLLSTGATSLENASVSANTTGAAQAGSIRISAATLSMIGLAAADGTAPVSVSTSSTGAGGDIVLNIGSLNIAKDASLQAFTAPPLASPSLATGAGGNITVDATRNVHIDGTGATYQTGLAAETRGAFSGPAGNVTVNAPKVELINTGEITSLTKGISDAGQITLNAGSVLIDGRNAQMLTGLQGRVGEGGEDMGASGKGGKISVTAHRIRLENNGVITASTFGTGPGGTVDIAADSMQIAGSAGAPNTGVFAQSFPVANLTGPGPGGDIHVKVNNLLITGPRGPAQAADDNSIPPLSGISAQSLGGSQAGQVTVQAQYAQIGRGGAVTVQAGTDKSPAGRAGTVSVSAAGKLIIISGTISAAGATGGNIRLTAGQFIYLRHGTVTAHAVGNGLRITIDPPAVVLAGASTINGLSGKVPVVVRIDGALIKSPDSRILTNSGEQFPQVDLTGALVPLQADFADAGARLAPACGINLGSGISSFVVTGRGGLAPEPDAWQSDWVLQGP